MLLQQKKEYFHVLTQKWQSFKNICNKITTLNPGAAFVDPGVAPVELGAPPVEP